MNRTQLAHILRAAAGIAGDGRILVIGSQAILATYSDEELPDLVTMSVEADLAFFDDADNAKSDRVMGRLVRSPCSIRRSDTTGRVSASPRPLCPPDGRIGL